MSFGTILWSCWLPFDGLFAWLYLHYSMPVNKSKNSVANILDEMDSCSTLKPPTRMLWKIWISGYCLVEEMTMSLNFSPYASPNDFHRERNLIPPLSLGDWDNQVLLPQTLFLTVLCAAFKEGWGRWLATLKAKTPGHPDINNEMISRTYKAMIGLWADCAKQIV